MAYTQAYTAYKETGVKTASQGKLIVMLYTEAVKQLDAALQLFGTNGKVPIKNIQDMHQHLSKTKAIITELMVSLDMTKGEDIAKNLMNLYVFFNQSLISASINQDNKKIKDVRTMMNDLRGAWITISTKASAPAPQIRPNLDING